MACAKGQRFAQASADEAGRADLVWVMGGLGRHAKGHRPFPEGNVGLERGWAGNWGRLGAGSRLLPLRPNSKAQSLVPQLEGSRRTQSPLCPQSPLLPIHQHPPIG